MNGSPMPLGDGLLPVWRLDDAVCSGSQAAVGGATKKHARLLTRYVTATREEKAEATYL
jgi:hypothetical protein